MADAKMWRRCRLPGATRLAPMVLGERMGNAPGFARDWARNSRRHCLDIADELFGGFKMREFGWTFLDALSLPRGSRGR
eukprot:scaffold1199_cov265-Pinguiococcus_pyrenoidosus.AAC.27